VSTQFTLYSASRLVVDLPPVHSDDPVPVRLVDYGSCVDVHGVVEANAITIDYDGDCAILPPQPTIETIDVPIGPLAPGTYDVVTRDRTAAFGGVPRLAHGTLRVRSPERCLGPTEERLCLQDGRFTVSGSWRAFDSTEGSARAAPIPDSDESGQLWFFSAGNRELTVKVLDGCAFNGRWWVFVSSASTVSYQVFVHDNVSGETRTYDNALGHAPALVADTVAFAGCP